MQNNLVELPDHLDDLPLGLRSLGENRGTRLARRRGEELLDNVSMSKKRVWREALNVLECEDVAAERAEAKTPETS